MVDLAKLVVSMEANTAKFQKDMERVDARMKRFERNTRNVLDTVTRGFAGLGLGILFRETVRFADAIGDSARRAGLTAKAYQELRFAAGQLDVSHVELDAALSRFNKTLGDARRGSKEATKAFNELGLDPTKFKDADSAFIAVTQRLGGMGDQFARASLQAQIFGRDAGPKLAEFLGASSSEVARLRKEAHELGAVLSDEAIAKADQTAKRFEALSNVVAVQFSEALLNLAPMITGVADKLVLLTSELAAGFKQAQLFADQLSRLAAFGEFQSGFGQGKFNPEKTNEAHAAKVRELEAAYRELGEAIARVEAGGGSSAKTRSEILRKRQAEVRAEIDSLSGSATSGGGLVEVPQAQPTVTYEIGKTSKAAKDYAAALERARREVLLLDDAEGEAAQMRALVNDLYAKGKIPQDAYLAFLAEANQQIDDLGAKDVEEKISAFADQAARNIQSFTASLVDAAMAGENMADAVVAALRRIAAEMLTSMLLQSLGDSLSSSGNPFLATLGKGLSGARAEGGPVSGGGAYLVGEEGPELFVPRTSGNIVPNGSFGGKGKVEINVDARGADPTSTANMMRALADVERRIYENFQRGTAPVPA